MNSTISQPRIVGLKRGLYYFNVLRKLYSLVVLFFARMASKGAWSQEDLVAAVHDIREKKISFRRAEAAYGILYDYATGKVEFGSKPGPSSILTAAEEQMIVEYAIEMSRIGYGRTREQILEIVKKVIDKDERPNPFKHNKPGSKWWKLFKNRHPELVSRVPEPLQLARAKCCTPEAIQA